MHDHRPFPQGQRRFGGRRAAHQSRQQLRAAPCRQPSVLKEGRSLPANRAARFRDTRIEAQIENGSASRRLARLKGPGRCETPSARPCGVLRGPALAAIGARREKRTRFGRAALAAAH